MQTGLSLGISTRLYAVSAIVSLALAALAAYTHFSLAGASDKAHFTQTTRVPQLEATSELELNVTQVSLQLRHAMLARNEQELNTTLQVIGEKQQHMNEVLGAFEKRLFSPQGKEHYKTLPPLLADFWKVGAANIALIKEGRRRKRLPSWWTPPYRRATACSKACLMGTRSRQKACGVTFKKSRPALPPRPACWWVPWC
ncbi:MAG: hypothetical protein C0443_05055 [Comamonadaceae bacterium]|nr:hypothetical protein [Comamonadaceae bacterium]